MKENELIDEGGFTISKIMYYIIMLIIFFVIALGIFTNLFIHNGNNEPSNEYHSHIESAP